MLRTILHCDLNNFFASVECVKNTELKNKNVAVCGNPNERHGIVLAKNTSAKKLGVKTGEAIWQAKEKCPDLVIVEPNYQSYVNYSRKVREIYLSYTDKVEAFGMDECWLDITDTVPLCKGEEFADKLRNEIKEKTGLTISVGVSFNKIYAKLGSDMKKPDATTLINLSNYKQKIYPLNVDEMLMIGAKTKNALKQFNISTIGDLANSDVVMLQEHFGILGKQMQINASGQNDTPVINNDFKPDIKSVGHGTTTKVDMCDYASARQIIFTLSEMVATRLRRYALKAKLVHIDLRYNNLTHLTKQAPLSCPTATAIEIAEKSFEMLKYCWNPTTDLPLRTLTISTSKLIYITEELQLNIFDLPKKNNDKLERMIDGVRKKYGYESISKGILLNNEIMIDKYCNEDDLLPFKR